MSVPGALACLRLVLQSLSVTSLSSFWYSVGPLWLGLFCLPVKEFYGTRYQSGLLFLDFMWGVFFTACVVFLSCSVLARLFCLSPDHHTYPNKEYDEGTSVHYLLTSLRVCFACLLNTVCFQARITMRSTSANAWSVGAPKPATLHWVYWYACVCVCVCVRVCMCMWDNVSVHVHVHTQAIDQIKSFRVSPNKRVDSWNLFPWNRLHCHFTRTLAGEVKNFVPPPTFNDLKSKAPNPKIISPQSQRTAATIPSKGAC